MPGEAATVDGYLQSLPDDRRRALEEVRRTILSHLPKGYEEAINWGMITYQVPLHVYGDTYNGRPLMYAALASQKHHMAVYLTSIYADENRRTRFEAQYRATGKRYDVGKSCVRFKRLDDLPLDVIGNAIASTSLDDFVARDQELRAARRRDPSS